MQLFYTTVFVNQDCINVRFTKTSNSQSNFARNFSKDLIYEKRMVPLKLASTSDFTSYLEVLTDSFIYEDNRANMLKYFQYVQYQ